jgi:hypothetical protein
MTETLGCEKGKHWTEDVRRKVWNIKPGTWSSPLEKLVVAQLGNKRQTFSRSRGSITVYTPVPALFYITQTVHCLKYRVSQTNHMHTLLYTKMFELHSYMFWTVIRCVIFEIVTLPADESNDGSKHVGA